MPTDLIKEIVKQAIRQELLQGADPVSPSGQAAPRIPGQRQRFVKTTLVDQKLVFEEGSLPDSMEDLVDALAEAIARVIKNLQITPLAVTITTPSPAAGTTVPTPTQNVTITSLVRE